jgi:transcriptional/translational regulatory protein YebC/TACO1
VTASAQITMVPQTTVEIAGDDVVKMLKLMDALEEHDDVSGSITATSISPMI